MGRRNGLGIGCVGGVADPIHPFVSLPSAVSVGKAMQLPKGISSKWVHDTLPADRGFEWQEGYGAFSLGVSGIEDTVRYIESQAEHHRRLTFREELELFLKKHGMEYVDRDFG